MTLGRTDYHSERAGLFTPGRSPSMIHPTRWCKSLHSDRSSLTVAFLGSSQGTASPLISTVRWPVRRLNLALPRCLPPRPVDCGVVHLGLHLGRHALVGIDYLFFSFFAFSPMCGSRHCSAASCAVVSTDGFRMLLAWARAPTSGSGPCYGTPSARGAWPRYVPECRRCRRAPGCTRAGSAGACRRRCR